MPPKVILVGLDGGTWRILRPMVEDGKLKHVEEIMDEGAYGVLESTIPYITITAWTSMFTGVNPGKHGIPDYVARIDGEITLCTSVMREADTIWHMLSDNGRHVILLNDPSSYPPEPIGIHVTGFLAPQNTARYVYPPELRKELDKAAGGYVPEVRHAYYQAIREDINKAYQMLKEYAEKLRSAFLHLTSNHEWDVSAVIFTSTDRLQHFYWNNPHYIQDHYLQLDKYLGEIMNIASSEEANLVIASDHGFTGMHTHFYINSLLHKLGYLKPVEETPITGGMKRLGITREAVMGFLSRCPPLLEFARKLVPSKIKRSILPRTGMRIDAKRSKALAVTDTGIFINDPTIKEKLVEELKALNIGNSSPIREIYQREEVMWGPYTDRAPDLLVIPREGIRLRPELLPGKIIAPLESEPGRPPKTGDHERDGVVMMYGPNIKSGHLHSLKIWDVAPTILSLSGLPIPSYFDGQPPTQALKGVEIKILETAITLSKRKIRMAVKRVKSRLKKKRT